MDQFSKVYDFGRAYGALAWNLAKVIHRKDMPEINTICVPHDEEMKEPTSTCLPLEDLRNIRKQVVDVILNAPAARIDNMISKVSDAAHLLLLHSRMIMALKQKETKMKRSKWLTAASTLLCGGLLTGGMWWEFHC